MEEVQQKESSGFYCPAYDGLRCVGLLVVLEAHYLVERVAIEKIWFMSFAVPTFFVLSGFLISHILFRYQGTSPAQALKVFYIRRALRILPAFYAVLLVATLAGGVPYLGWQAAYLINFKMFSLSALDPAAFRDFMAFGDLNGEHLWTVAVEEQFYLLFPLFVFFTAPRWRTGLLAGGIVLSIALRLWFLSQQPRTCYGVLTPVAGEFILWGCLLAWMDHRNKLRLLRTPEAMYSSLALLGLLFYVESDVARYIWGQWRPAANQTLFAVPLAVFVMALKYSPQSWLARALSWKPARWIGKISYSGYLVHLFLNPVVDALLEAWPPLVVFPTCPRAVLGPIITIAVAALMWVSFEGPLNRLKVRWRVAG